MAVANTMLGQQPKVKGPKVTRATYDEMRAREYKSSRDPMVNALPAPLFSDKKYLFRSLPRTIGAFTPMLDLHPNIDGGLDMDNPKHKLLVRRWENFYHKNDTDADRQFIQDVYDELGGQKVIYFQPLFRKRECFYATNSEIVAKYIRQQMATKRGEWAYIYEQDQSKHWVVAKGGPNAKAFPNTDAGLRMANEYMTEIGATTLEMVADDDETTPTEV